MGTVKRAFSLYSDDEEEERDEGQREEKRKRSDDSGISGGDGDCSTGKTNEQEKEEGGTQKRQITCKAPPLLCALGTKRGERDEMQDAHVTVPCLLSDRIDIFRSSLYAIFDGHGGSRAALFCEKYLPPIMAKKMGSFSDVISIEKSLKRIFTETYKQVDERFLVEARKEKPVWKDGTTATTVLILNNNIYSANIGDSRAIVARRKCNANVSTSSPSLTSSTISPTPSTALTPVQLTIDHSPQLYEERMRIQKAGGIVKDGRIMGILEVSRSIGDGQYKAQGVTSTPDIKKMTIKEDDNFLLIACDGLWKCFSNEEAVQFVVEHLGKAKEEESIRSESNNVEQLRWEKVADQLASEAVRRKCGDNVSVMLIRLEGCSL